MTMDQKTAILDGGGVDFAPLRTKWILCAASTLQMRATRQRMDGGAE